MTPSDPKGRIIRKADRIVCDHRTNGPESVSRVARDFRDTGMDSNPKGVLLTGEHAILQMIEAGGAPSSTYPHCRFAGRRRKTEPPLHGVGKKGM